MSLHLLFSKDLSRYMSLDNSDLLRREDLETSTPDQHRTSLVSLHLKLSRRTNVESSSVAGFLRGVPGSKWDGSGLFTIATNVTTIPPNVTTRLARRTATNLHPNKLSSLEPAQIAAILQFVEPDVQLLAAISTVSRAFNLYSLKVCARRRCATT